MLGIVGRFVNHVHCPFIFHSLRNLSARIRSSDLSCLEKLSWAIVEITINCLCTVVLFVQLVAAELDQVHWGIVPICCDVIKHRA